VYHVPAWVLVSVTVVVTQSSGMEVVFANPSVGLSAAINYVIASFPNRALTVRWLSCACRPHEWQHRQKTGSFEARSSRQRHH